MVTPGARLGPYEILEVLGAGGMGEVWRAKDPRLGREVAIKVLPSSFSQDPERLRRFEQEARAAGILNHPNITAVYDVGVHEGAPYVVQELLEGETLRQRLAQGVFTPRKALGHALQIAHGLAAAHEKGIVHRDLKPENVFVTRDGRVKLLDFGLAKLAGKERESEEASRLPTMSPSTEPGMVLGTVGYMSPEQVRGRPADARSDIFSFGAILYEMLAGRRAFQGQSAADTMSAILREEPPPLSESRRGVDPGLERVVTHCLEKNPEERFQSARDLAFDLETLSGVTPGREAGKPLRAVRPAVRRAILAAAALFAAALAAVVVVSRVRGGRGPIDSIAVLPFANGSGDPSTEYLSDGITESVINSLSRIPQLRVIARSTAFRYKTRDADPQKVGRELNVRGVVSGRVVERGDTVAVQADLVDASTGAQLWGDRYERKASDIVSVPEAIAGQISEKLRLRLTGEEKQKVVKRETTNTEAYQLYLKGRYAWEKRTAKDLALSIQYFEQAIAKDPTYALAYSGLADSYAVLSSYSLLSPEEAYPRARAAARKAFEIEPDLSQPHATLGLVLTDFDRAFPAAEAEYRKAIELDPNNATAHHWYGIQLTVLGRHDQALEEMRRARELDPFSAIIQNNLSRALLYARQLDRAREENRKAIALNPDFGPAHFMAGEISSVTGMRNEAAAEFRTASRLIGNTGFGMFTRARAQLLEDDRAGALRTIDELTALAEKRYVSPTYLATIYVALGDQARALDWLEKACEKRSFDSLFAAVNPIFDPLRANARFAEVLRCLNLAGSASR